MNIRTTISIFALTAGLIAGAQEILALWEAGKAPYYKENSLLEYEEEMWGTRCLLGITEPTLTIYSAKGVNTGKAVLIIPGGGYEMVAIQHEGHDLAAALSEVGITAGVLKYRIPKPVSSTKPHLVPITDARRALALLRESAHAYGFNEDQVGVMGFSAGSHLATALGLWKSNHQNENPNFSCLVYGVTDLSPENQEWLEKSLYHRDLFEDEIRENTLLDLVDSDTPPAFLVHAYDDNVCYVKESIFYAEKLRKNNVEVEMHLFQNGGHGFGVGREEDGTDQWVPLFINWMKRL